MKSDKIINEMTQKLLSGDRRSAAQLITLVEDEAEENHEAMKQIYPYTGKATIVGITGSAGSGKSCLIDHLIRKFRQQGKAVGVVVVDPSSPFSGGAFLGDRIRLQSHSSDDGVYIRSMASRGYLGGLARATHDVIRIIEAMGRDIVIVETLGAGQDEIDVIHIAQTCVLVTTPGMGDEIQALKAGLMEIADIIVLNKADLDGANTCIKNLQASLSFTPFKEGEWVPQVIPTVAVASKPEDIQGIDELVAGIVKHQEYLHTSSAIERVRFKRVEQELGLIFKDELQKIIFKGLKGTGKKKKYIKSIMEGKNDPYSVVEEILSSYLITGEGKRNE
ncbi:MAG: methylmalonyl Co-A mutase-associated GTPase MeaB [Desulfobacteraceae bacterium]|nr:methylmalonyl Co-A mutase-associated GTPase MeaB [Desulfobacteraceae bacterium]